MRLQVSRRSERFGPVAIADGHTLVWSIFTKHPTKYSNGVLTCRATHRKHAMAGHQVVAFGVEVSAFGQVVSATGSGRNLVITTTCPTTKVLVGPEALSLMRCPKRCELPRISTRLPS